MSNEKAEIDYQNGMKYKEIAEKYSVSLNTVKSWKQRHGWERKKGAHKEKRVHTKNKASPVVDAVDEKTEVAISENSDLTDKQKLFCIYYLKYFNATKAYKKAYGCTYESAMVSGHHHLRKPKIKREIDRLKEERSYENLLSIDDIIQKYMDIAFADITDYVSFGTRELLARGADGNQVTVEEGFVDIKSSDDVDGTILSEVKMGQNGVSVKLADRMKALERLEQFVGYMSEEQQARIAVLKSKVPNKDGIDPQAQINALADLINNPVPERVLDDD